MIGPSLLSFAAAGLLASGILATAVTDASAHKSQYGSSGFFVGIGSSGSHRVCKPIVKKVKWQDRKGRTHWSTKVVSQRCWWEPSYNWNDLPYNSPVYRIGPGNRWLGGW